MSPHIRILLVDDHDFLRRGLRAFFDREKGCAVVGEARNAEEAYEKLAATPADLVVLDLHLPGDDGITATAKIKAQHPRIKVLILSGRSATALMGGDVDRALRAGADGFVSKEDSEDCLGPAVAALMQGRNYLSPGPVTDLIRSQRAAAATPAADASQLTEQETAVLKRMAEGASYKDIAEELDISVKSVDTYRTRLTRKLELSSREDLVRYAIRQGLVKTG